MASTPLYDQIGLLYRRHRVPDPRISAQISAALGDAKTVLNVGAGAGSYEPADREIVAVEPSPVMIAQRPIGSAPIVRGVAGALPFLDGQFDASMAVLTIHHWPDQPAGLAEMQRVSGRVVIAGFDVDGSNDNWLVREYFPEIAIVDSDRAPSPERVAEWLGGNARIEVIPVPADCTDGFQNAYWRRPEAYLDPAVRACISTLAVLDDLEIERGVSRLQADLDSGAWHERHADLLELDELDCGYRLVVSDPA